MATPYPSAAPDTVLYREDKDMVNRQLENAFLYQLQSPYAGAWEGLKYMRKTLSQSTYQALKEKFAALGRTGN